MRIGIDARDIRWTGIGRYLQSVIKELLLLDQANTYVIFVARHEINKIEFPSDRVELVPVSGSYYSFSEQLVLPWRMLSAKLDLLHVPHFNFPLLYFRKKIITIHDIIPSFFPGSRHKSGIHKWAYRLVVRSAIKRARTIISVSEHTKQDLIKVFKANPKKIVVIPEAVDLQHFSPESDKQEDQKVLEKYEITEPYLLYVGVWRYHKNLKRLLESFWELRQQGHRIKLVITGKPGPHDQELLKLIESDRYKQHVITPGFVPEQELPSLYRSAKVFVFPSLYEGFGLPPLEAMACGTVVVASKNASLPEVLGGAAKFFDPEDIKDMTKTIEKLLNNTELRKELRERGFQQVKQFSWKRHAQKTLKLYQEILK